jgi:UDP-glucose 4-epimerase
MSDEALTSVNVRGTEDLLAASVAAGVRRFVFTSSVLVYGLVQPMARPITEDYSCRGSGTYAENNIDAETLVRRYHRKGLDYVILRPSLVYGLGAPRFERFIMQVLRYPLFWLSSDRNRTWQWIHLRDVAEAVVLAGSQPEARGNVFNVAGDEVIKLSDLVFIVQKIAGHVFRPYRSFLPGFTRDYTFHYDISKAYRLLGFTPKVPLEEGLAEIITVLRQKDSTAVGSYQLRGWTRRA